MSGVSLCPLPDGVTSLLLLCCTIPTNERERYHRLSLSIMGGRGKRGGGGGRKEVGWIHSSFLLSQLIWGRDLHRSVVVPRSQRETQVYDDYIPPDTLPSPFFFSCPFFPPISLFESLLSTHVRTPLPPYLSNGIYCLPPSL